MTDWKTVYSTEEPALLDTTSSQTTVHMRRDVQQKTETREVQREIEQEPEYDLAGNLIEKEPVYETIQEEYPYYEYQERTMTKEEYAMYLISQEQAQQVIEHKTEQDVEKAIDAYTLSLVEEGVI